MNRSSFLFAIALILLVIVLADMFLWFSVIDAGETFEESRTRYLSFFPAPLQNARLLTVIAILMLTAAGFIFLNARKTNSLRTTAAVLGLLSALMLMWQLFSLM